MQSAEGIPSEWNSPAPAPDLTIYFLGLVLLAGPVLFSRHANLLPMKPPYNMFHLALLLFFYTSISQALKFDLAAHTGHDQRYDRCVRNFVTKDTLVLVTAIVDGHKGDGQVVNMHVSGTALNESV